MRRSWHPPSSSLPPQSQLLLHVQSVHPFMVHREALAFQQDLQPPIAEPSPGRSQLAQPLSQTRIVDPSPPIQVAKNRYASQQYHDFIGFQVSKPLLERVFPIVYGLELKDVLPHEDLAIGSYRYSVSRLIPEMTQVALQTHKKDLMSETPNFAKQKFLYRLSRSDYEKEWGKDYVKPGLGTRILPTLLRYMPKIGPFKGLAFKSPTPQTEDLYIKSINTTVDQYRVFLEEVRTDTLVLPNCDFDSGNPTRVAEYSLTDQTYAKLLGQLANSKFDHTTPDLRDNILEFYSGASVSIKTKDADVRSTSLPSLLDQLRAATPVPTAEAVAAR